MTAAGGRLSARPSSRFLLENGRLHTVLFGTADFFEIRLICFFQREASLHRQLPSFSVENASKFILKVLARASSPCPGEQESHKRSLIIEWIKAAGDDAYYSRHFSHTKVNLNWLPIVFPGKFYIAQARKRVLLYGCLGIVNASDSY